MQLDGLRLPVQQPCINPSKYPESLRKALLRECGYLQVFCNLLKCRETHQTRLLISRFQVRVLGGSLGKSLDLQVKRNGAEKPPVLHRGLRQQCGSNSRLPQNLIYRIAYPAVHAWQDV
jgi:hypothetical protein